MFDQFLVERALGEVLGENAWTKEKRSKASDPSKTLTWYLATTQARSRADFEDTWASTNEREVDEEE